MFSFRQFIYEKSLEKGYTVHFYLHKDKSPIIQIIKSNINEGKLDPNAPTVTGEHGYAHFGEFKPTNLEDSKATLKELHEHLAKHGLYSATTAHPIHKDPHMQKFEDGIHRILGGGRHLVWHKDYPGARTKPGEFVPRDAGVWSSSDVSTKLGKFSRMVKGKSGKLTKIGIEEIPNATKPGTFTVFDDKTLYHKAPSTEERGERHFIRASDIRRIPPEGIPKAGGGFYDPSNKEDMDSYIKSKSSNVLNGMHKKLSMKISQFLRANKNAQSGSENYKKKMELIDFMNHPDHKDRFNADDWIKNYI